MEWYIPITILPGIGMLVLSTTTQTMALSGEINALLSNKCTDFEHLIADKKIKQLGLLTRSSTALYIAAGLYVLSGIIGALNILINASSIPLYIGTIFFFISLILLIIYAFRAVGIRKFQFANNHNL